MGKAKLKEERIMRIVGLRQAGHSLPEIQAITGHSRGTIWKYIKDVAVLPEYADLLRAKQGGSQERARKRWSDAALAAEREIGVSLSKRDSLLVLAALYWGEGNKRELNIINCDPLLLRTFLRGLYHLGVTKKDIRFSIRVFGKPHLENTKQYWARTLELTNANYVGCEIVNGNKVGKHKYGMCRIRVSKSERTFKLVMSMIDLIGARKPS